jgi:hypothetical protein
MSVGYKVTIRSLLLSSEITCLPLYTCISHVVLFPRILSPCINSFTEFNGGLSVFTRIHKRYHLVPLSTHPFSVHRFIHKVSSNGGTAFCAEFRVKFIGGSSCSGNEPNFFFIWFSNNVQFLLNLVFKPKLVLISSSVFGKFNTIFLFWLH